MASLPGGTNPYNATEVPSESASAVNYRFPWQRALAIPLGLYAALPLLYGGMGLIFVPGLLVGGVSLGRHTTFSMILLFILFNVLLVTHGAASLRAAVNLWHSRWQRLLSWTLTAMALALVAVGLVVAISVA